MTNPLKDPLLLIGKIFCILMQAAMIIGSIALAIAIPVILLAQGVIQREIVEDLPAMTEQFPALSIGAVMAIGLAILIMLFMFFGKLRKIIGTVGEGDPFQPANATRLSQMGWLMLGTQVVIVPAAIIAVQLERYVDAAREAGASDNLSLTFDDSGFSMTSILLVIILFILARVFRHGAAMRDDLEGTV